MRIILLTLICALVTATTWAAETITGKVVKVIDGDTIYVLSNGRTEKIRLAGIDCPEKKQPFGQVAKRFTLDLAALKIVKVEYSKTDFYGRKIGTVFLPNDINLNHALVEAGLAWWYRKYSQDKTLEKLEMQARQAGRGLWINPDPLPPWSWRKKR